MTSMNMTMANLQWHLIYSVIVAGKSAKFTDEAMKRLFWGGYHVCPFDMFRKLIQNGLLNIHLRSARTGNYTKLEKCIRQLVAVEIDLATCSPADLEEIHGIGPKTSRFFILWTRPGAKYAALDVHILRWLKNAGYNAPRSTPSSPAKYSELEQAFLTEARLRGMSPRELDHKIWSEGSGYM